MGVSARAGVAFPADGVGTPILAVDEAGNLAPVGITKGDDCSTQDVHLPSASTAAVITLAAVADRAHVVSGLIISLNGSGTLTVDTTLTIADGSDTVFQIGIEAKGVYVIPFTPPKRGRSGRAMTITLTDPGDNVTAKLNLMGHWLTFVIAGGELDFNDEMNSGLLALSF